MSELVTELEATLKGLDPKSDEFAEISHAIEVLKGVSYAVDEGLVTIEQDDQGETRFFPAEATPEAVPAE